MKFILTLLSVLSLEATDAFIFPSLKKTALISRVSLAAAAAAKNSSEAAHENLSDYRDALGKSRTNGEKKEVRKDVIQT